jgi:hypothetical protein
MDMPSAAPMVREIAEALGFEPGGRAATGLALAKAADVLEVTGPIDAAVRERAYELGGTLAATLIQALRAQHPRR